MSVAYDLAPTVSAPVVSAPARAVAPVAVPGYAPVPDRPQRLADVAVLHPPIPERAPLRLTRRGVVVLAIGLALLAVGLVWLARSSAPQPAAQRAAVHVVVVQPGDTLWGIAVRVAPGSDPQAEVDRLMHRNHLTDPGQLRPGLELRVP